MELSRLFEVEHANALAPEQTLEFDADLTVLFGQNGSGKTRYARILKRISAVMKNMEVACGSVQLRVSELRRCYASAAAW